MNEGNDIEIGQSITCSHQCSSTLILFDIFNVVNVKTKNSFLRRWKFWKFQTQTLEYSRAKRDSKETWILGWKRIRFDYSITELGGHRFHAVSMSMSTPRFSKNSVSMSMSTPLFLGIPCSCPCPRHDFRKRRVHVHVHATSSKKGRVHFLNFESIYMQPEVVQKMINRLSRSWIVLKYTIMTGNIRSWLKVYDLDWKHTIISGK